MRSNFACRRRPRSALGLSPAAMAIGQRLHAKLCVGVCDGIVAANVLIDTGAILALLDGTDRWHRTCVDAFGQLDHLW